MVWTFDGQVWAKYDTPPSMNRPMYLLINLAVGGKWYSEEMRQAGTPYKPWEVDEATMPWMMKCDYVRVFQAADSCLASPLQSEATVMRLSLICRSLNNRSRELLA